jgi:hypothetical protein
MRQDVLQLTLEAASALAGGELERNGIEQRRMTISDPRSTCCTPRARRSSSRFSQAAWFSRSPVVKAISSRRPAAVMPTSAKIGVVCASSP